MYLELDNQYINALYGAVFSMHKEFYPLTNLCPVKQRKGVQGVHPILLSPFSRVVFIIFLNDYAVKVQQGALLQLLKITLPSLPSLPGYSTPPG